MSLFNPISFIISGYTKTREPHFAKQNISLVASATQAKIKGRIDLSD